jgi:N6-L-threonylcarbamoyladenine synthase
MLTLGIESTCDETSCALVRDGYDIISLKTSSQIDLHRQFGGVVPELACRSHIDVISCVLSETLQGHSLQEIDLIATAKGPGLVGALLVGIHFAKGLAYTLRKPLVGVNHIEAHLYAAIMSCPEDKLLFPSLGVVLSGGHTSLVLIDAIGSYRLIGETVDDAIGEAFDKVAKLLSLPYPGGPEIEKLAEGICPRPLFRPGVVKGRPFDFSFSGIKTAVLYHLQSKKDVPTFEEKQEIAASFQEACFSDLMEKISRSIEYFSPKALFFGGGVSQNEALRKKAKEALSPPLYFPKKELCLDNGAMIAGLGFQVYKREHKDSLFSLEPETRIPFEMRLFT